MRRGPIQRLGLGALQLLLASVVPLPFLWMVSVSLKPPREPLSIPARLWPDHPTLANYAAADRPEFRAYVVNTLIVPPDRMMRGRDLLDTLRALTIAYVSVTLPIADLSQAVLRRAGACLKVAPFAAAEMKRLLREGADAPLETARSYEQEVLFRLHSTEDGREGIGAFLDKRDPRFKGAWDGAQRTGGHRHQRGQGHRPRLRRDAPCAGGARVLLADLDEATGAAAAAPLGERAAFRRADLRDMAQVRAMAEAAVALWGGIDVLVNNAAIAERGVNATTVQAADDLAPHGIRVNAVAPGTLMTPMNERIFETHPTPSG